MFVVFLNRFQCFFHSRFFYTFNSDQIVILLQEDDVVLRKKRLISFRLEEMHFLFYGRSFDMPQESFCLTGRLWNYFL